MHSLMVWCGIVVTLVTLVAGARSLVIAEDALPATSTPSPEGPAAPASAVTSPTANSGQAFTEIVFTNVGDAGRVTFTHFGHGNATCADCHEGVAPLFPQHRTHEGYKMADMYAGKSCGACHDGKKAFAAMGDCTKCHQAGN